MIRLTSLAVAAAVVATACAGPDLSDTRRSIVGGSASANDAVVALLGQVGAATYLCSGALISPRVILTAAHCVADRDSIDALFGSDIHADGGVVTTIAATYWEADASWDPSSSDLFDHHYDIGLVVLGADAPVAPLAINRTAMTDPDLGGTLRLIGYGNTANGAIDSGTRLEASTTLRQYDDWWTTGGDQNGTTCVGDSGGPQLMTIGGDEVIVGVTSFGTAPAGQELCKFDTIAARVDVVATDFIDPFIARYDPPAGDPDAGADPQPQPDAGSGGGGGDDNHSGGCSTGGSAGLLFGLLLLAIARRRLRVRARR